MPRQRITNDDIRARFQYYAPRDAADARQFEEIRYEFALLAQRVSGLANCGLPEAGRQRSLAITALHQALMHTNAALAMACGRPQPLLGDYLPEDGKLPVGTRIPGVGTVIDPNAPTLEEQDQIIARQVERIESLCAMLFQARREAAEAARERDTLQSLIGPREIKAIDMREVERMAAMSPEEDTPGIAGQLENGGASVSSDS